MFFRRKKPKENRGFERQLAFEAEGAAAGSRGAEQEDCPYDRETQSFEWNHWIYGWSMGRYEYDAMQRGTVDVQCYTTIFMEHIQPNMMGVQEAYEQGYWKPKHVRIPDEWVRAY